MSLLERRYRAVLRLLPASYRAAREDEMVAEFMDMSGDVPDEVNPRPRWGEIASVLALSLRVRLGGTRTMPRFFAWGETVRLVALLGLAYQTVYAVLVAADLVRGLTTEAGHHLLGDPESFQRMVVIGRSGAALCSAVAFVAIMRGHARLAKVTAPLGIVPALGYVVEALISGSLGETLPLAEAGNLALVAAPVIALLMGFHSDAPPRRRSWWPTLLPIAAGLALWGAERVVLTIQPKVSPGLWLWVDLAGMAVVVFAVAGVITLVRRLSPSWALALAATGVLLLGQRLPVLPYTGEDEVGMIAFATSSVQCALLGVLVVALVVAGLRSLPAASRDPAVAP